MTAGRPSDTSPWVDADAAPLPGPSVLPDRCSVAVIGGSLAGVATALFLAEGGVDVVLLEAHSQVGLGASGRHLGHVDTGLGEHPHRTLKALGPERTAALFGLSTANHQLLEARGLLDRCGGLRVALDQREPDDIDQSVQALVDAGIAAEVLAPHEVDQRTGCYNLGPALLIPGDGQIDPWITVRTLADAAQQAGATLIGNAAARVGGQPVDGIPIEVGDALLVADAVVIAAGARSASADEAFTHALNTVRETALQTAPVFAYYPGVVRAGHGYTFWRQHPDGGLLVGGCRWATPHLEVGETDDSVVVDRVHERIEALFRFHMPAAEETEVVARWSWIHCTARDGLPLIGPMPGDPRRIACVGFGGNPAGMAVAAARGVADGLLNGVHDIPDFLSAIRMIRWR